MTDFAQVEKGTGKVLNVIVVDKEAPPEFDEAFDWIEVTDETGPAFIRGTFDGISFIPPPKPEGMD